MRAAIRLENADLLVFCLVGHEYPPPPPPSTSFDHGQLGPSMSLLVVGPTIPVVGRTRVPISSADVLGPGFPARPVCLRGPLPFLRLSIIIAWFR